MPNKGRVENFQGKGFHTNPERRYTGGRVPKLLKGMIKQLKEAGIEKATVSNVVEAYEMLLNCNEEYLKRLLTDSNTPMTARIVAKAMLSKDGYTVLEKMLDRVDKTASNPANSKDITITIIHQDKESAELLLNE
jgi:hypothetical protein